MNSREVVQSMFHAIEQERPESWPHGIGYHMFNKAAGEDVYMVREKQSSTPVGFVGWQVRKEAGQNVGYYSVGILPQFRGQSFAKEAVAKLIRIKSAGVDTVKALVQKDNTASLALAESLGIPVTKCASFSGAEKEAASRLGPAIRSSFGALRRGINRPAVADTLLGVGGAAAGYGLGELELNGLEAAGLHPGSTAQHGVPLTNAAVGMLLSPRVRGALYGDMSGPHRNRAILNSVLGKIGMNAGLVGLDQGIGLAGKAQEAAKGLGDAGQAMTAAADSVKKEVPNVMGSLSSTAGNISNATGQISKATEGLPRLIENLGSSASFGSDMKAPIDKGVKALGDIGSLADKANQIVSSPTTKTIGMGAAGGLGGYALANSLLDEAPRGHPKYQRNRKLKALAALLGAGGGAMLQHKLRPI